MSALRTENDQSIRLVHISQNDIFPYKISQVCFTQKKWFLAQSLQLPMEINVNC